MDASASFPSDLRSRFRLVGIANHGPSGTLFEAYERAADRRVGVKVLADTPVSPLEADLIRRVQLDGVARVLEWTPRGAGSVLVVEMISGPTFDQFAAALRDKPAQLIRSVALPVCAALRQLHARGLLHNGIRSGNVRWRSGPPTEGGLVAAGGDPILVDFGPGALRRDGPPANAADPMTLPPERHRGAPWDERADLYGLGALLFRALAGQPHATARRDNDRLAALEAPSRLSVLRPDLGAAAGAVDRMLAPTPADRFPDAEAAATALAAASGAPPPTEERPEAGPIVRTLEAAPARVLAALVALARPADDNQIAEVSRERDPTRALAFLGERGLVNRSAGRVNVNPSVPARAPFDRLPPSEREELRSRAARVIERLAREAAARAAPATDAPPASGVTVATPAPAARLTLAARVEALERQVILETLAAEHGNQRRTADALGLSRRGLWLKMRRYGIPLRRQRQTLGATFP